MKREADNPMTESDFDWMVSNRAVWGWKAPVKASVSGVSLLQLSPFFVACVASVSSRGSSRKLRQEQKKMNDGGGGGERRDRLPANPAILKNCVRPRTQLLIGVVRVVFIT